MTEVEILPDASEIVTQVQKHKGWNPVYRRALEELLKTPALLCALSEILVQSDETLKNVGLTDLTQEDSIKHALRAQGVAQGLTQAVELICGLASEPENPPAEEKEND